MDCVVSIWKIPHESRSLVVNIGLYGSTAPSEKPITLKDKGKVQPILLELIHSLPLRWPKGPSNIRKLQVCNPRGGSIEPGL